jgi:hypothetical protein
VVAFNQIGQHQSRKTTVISYIGWEFRSTSDSCREAAALRRAVTGRKTGNALIVRAEVSFMMLPRQQVFALESHP